MIRSMLFVPSDSERKLARAAGTAADALVLDLEGSVLSDHKNLARATAREYLRAADEPLRRRLWFRVNDLGSSELLKNLVAIAGAAPRGIVLPNIRGPEDAQTVSHYLDALEAVSSLASGSLRIVVLATEAPLAVLRLSKLAGRVWPRLQGLLWGANDLNSIMCAGNPRRPDDSWRPTFAHARLQCLLAAHVLGVEAIDTAYLDYRNPEGLRESCRLSRHDGFTGNMAIHADQLSVINNAFQPSQQEIVLTRRIEEAFAGWAGAISIGGRMYDIPHLKAAKRLLNAV